MPAPSVSVALCTCNGARYIVEQIESILHQTSPVAEIVVHDDASDDDTVALVERTWAAHRERSEGHVVPQLRVTRHARRLGVARNFESALLACRGDLIALCDQDDRWDPDRLAVLVPRFADPAVLLVHGNAILVDAAGAPQGGSLFDALAITPAELGLIELGRGWVPLLDRNLVTGATALLRRTLRDASLPLPPHWLHDEWLGMVAALLGGLRVERRPLLAYRQHGANQIGARRARLIDLVRRAQSDRGQWHADKMQRANELLARARDLGGAVDPEALQTIEQKAEHHRVRAQLPAARHARLWPVWREWKTGRYRRFGRGLHGVLRDLLQPSGAGAVSAAGPRR